MGSTPRGSSPLYLGVAALHPRVGEMEELSASVEQSMFHTANETMRRRKALYAGAMD